MARVDVGAGNGREREGTECRGIANSVEARAVDESLALAALLAVVLDEPRSLERGHSAVGRR